MHKPIIFKELSINFKHTTCIDCFSAQVNYGDRIAIIGKNGSGKTSLLNVMLDKLEPSSGAVLIPDDVKITHVAQVIEDHNILSGGQRFNKSLTKAISASPNVLLLDEPTNHLDKKNRKSLMLMLNRFAGTLIIVTHDAELLRHCVGTLWSIEHTSIQIFSGYYDDYRREQQLKKRALEQKLAKLHRDKKQTHESLMQEQHRAAKSKASGKKSIDNRKWPTVVSKAKVGRSEKTSGRKKSAIMQQKDTLLDELNLLNMPETILPTFSLPPTKHANEVLLMINDGKIGYLNNEHLLSNIYLSVSNGERVAIHGANGSGKTTLIKAILDRDNVHKEGEWQVLSRQYIGYLDQHYRNIPKDISVLEALSSYVIDWDTTQCRRHLADFLFKGNDGVNINTNHLSGGERVRLSLAMIAANPPKLLILDEITNNLDIETMSHVKNVIAAYPGAILVISHSDDFLHAIRIDKFINVEEFAT